MAFEAPLYYLGLTTAGYFTLKVGSFLYHYLRPSSLMRYNHGAESWALITGASNGIGLGFAKELCRKGFNVILLGHKPDELQSAKATLERQSPNAKIKILVANAICVSQTQIEESVAEIKDFHITILVNNIGGLPLKEGFFKPLIEYTMEEIDDTIYLNTRFMARLTRVLLPILVRNGPSLIINMGSGGQVGLPYEVMYSGTKAFVSGFTAALGIEARVEQLPIELLAFTPGSIRSGSNLVPLSWFVPSADKWAKEALGRVGCGYLVVPGYWRHALQIFMLRNLPESMRQNALADVMKKTKETQTLYTKKDI